MAQGTGLVERSQRVTHCHSTYLCREGVGTDPQSLAALLERLDEHLALAGQLGDENPWKPPGHDDQEAGRCEAGIYALDTLVVRFLELLGRPGTSLRAVGKQAAKEIHQKARERYASWVSEQGADVGCLRGSAGATALSSPPFWRASCGMARFGIR